MSTVKMYRRSELEAIRPAVDVDGCLARYRALYIDGVDDTSDMALVGIGGHAVKHRYIQRLVEKQIPQDAEEADEAFVEGIALSKTPARLIPEIRKVWQFHVPHFELQLDKFLIAEERQESGDIRWTPDLVLVHPERDELEVIDDKWGWNPPLSEDELRMLFQARVYSFYARSQWKNFSSYRFTLNAVRYGKYVSVVFRENELDSVAVELRAAIAIIEEATRTNEWPEIAGPTCHFCALPCKLADQVLAIPKRLAPAQRQTIGAWLLAHERLTAAVKKVFKADISGNGPVTVNGMVWDNRQTISRNYPAKAVVEALQQVAAVGGLDPTADSGLTISQSALNPFFRQFPKIQQMLEPLAQTKTSYRFSARKPGANDEEDDA